MNSSMCNKTVYLFILVCIILFCSKLTAQDICEAIEGAKVIADDGKYLGKICSSFDSESIINEFGSYGNEFNSNSIWNEFGTYGNEFSNLSPFNEFTSTPPMIIKNGLVIGYLTKNKSLKNAVDPHILLSCEFGLSSLPKSLKHKIEELQMEQKKLIDAKGSDDHWIQKVIDNGKFILLEDNSLWEVSSIDIIYSSLWLPISNIIIVESKNPEYPYILINTDDSEKVEVKLIKK